MKRIVTLRERIYFFVSLLTSIALYALLISIIFGFMAQIKTILSSPAFAHMPPNTSDYRIIYFYFALIIVRIVFAGAYRVGMLRGNAIRVTKNQFPDLYATLHSHSRKLGLKKAPSLYILQGNGLLNAFATKYVSKNFVVIYSDVLAAAYNEGKPAVDFILGHELGHIKRNHTGMLKNLILLPSRFVPFIGSAYSRACEYTCDNIGYSLCPEGAEKGLLILAAGPKLYSTVNVEALIETTTKERGLLTWLAEIFSSHPLLMKRIQSMNANIQKDANDKTNIFVVEQDKGAVIADFVDTPSETENQL